MAVERDTEVDDSAGERPAPAASAESYPHLRHNYLAHAIEGGLYMGGLTFVNANTLLPKIVQTLGGPPWLVSQMPSLLWIGYALPMLLTAHWIDRLHRYKPLLLVTGVMQRVPFLFAAIGLVLAKAYGYGTLAMIAVASAPLISGIMGGVTLAAWQQLIVKTVPENRRSSLFAIRYMMSCVIGIAAGYIVEWVLRSWLETEAYAILHLCIFVFLAGSYIIFATIREPAREVPADHISPGLIENLKAIPALLRGNRPFALYMVARFFRNGLYIITAFLAIHALKVLDRPESYLGPLLLVQMIGAIAGNLLAGWLGDRMGGKITMLGGCAVLAGLSCWAPFARTSLEFQVIFFLYGVGWYASEVGTQILVIELSPVKNRSTYLAIGWLTNLPGMLLASMLGGWLWAGQERLGGLALLTVLWLAVSIGVLTLIREPRKADA